MSPGRILTGTCSWTDPTLIDSGRFYPRTSMSAAERLRFYAAHFPIVEVDSTYYAPPAERNAVLWTERTPPEFVFNVKAFAMLTGHGAAPTRLPTALRGMLGAEALTKRNVYLNNVSDEFADLLWEIHRRALAPLREAGKLGALLFQFPPWFVRSSGAVEHLRRLRRELPDDHIAVEFRGGSWMDDAHAADTLALLEKESLAYVCVDEPQGFRSSTPPVVAVTAEPAMVRLHGRNAETWERKTKAASDRFRYVYGEGELREWVPLVKTLAENAAVVHVLFNNNYQDYNVRNARQMALLLEEAKLDVAPVAREESDTGGFLSLAP